MYDRSKTNNQKLLNWLDEVIALCKPKDVRWADGSEEEWKELCEGMVTSGSMIRLNEEKRPGSFLARSDPRDAWDLLMVTGPLDPAPHWEIASSRSWEGEAPAEP